jgi:PAS domain-containing protein
LWDIYPGNDEKPLKVGFRRTIAEGITFTAELFEPSRNRRYAITASPDQSDGILVRFSDITERANGSSEQQATTPSRLDGIARNLPGFVYQTYVGDEGEWGVSFADQRASDIFGIGTPGNCIQEVYRCIAPEDQGRFIASVREATQYKKDWEFEGRFITPTGETKYIQGLSRARRRGNRTIHDGIILDITHLKHTEQALRDSEELYRHVFEVESDALLLVDRESGQILAANAAAIDLYVYSREQLLSLNRFHLSTEPDDTARAIRDMESFIGIAR